MSLLDLRDRLVQRLKAEQSAPGVFFTQTAPDLDLLNQPVQSVSPFFLSLILNCLAGIPGAEEVRSQLQVTLWKEVHAQGSFNYWLRDSEQTKTHPCPDDLDTTSCTYLSFLKTCPEKVDGARLAEIVLLLTLVEEAEGGPYRTWIVKPDADAVWKDVDLIVNANIATMLQACDVRLDGLDHYGAEKILTGDFQSVYYPLKPSVFYFLARAKFPGTQETLEREIRVLLEQGTDRLSILEWAMLMRALLEVSTSFDGLEPMMGLFLRRLESEELFSARAVYVEAIHSGVPFFAGSKALTIAMCLEALGSWMVILEKQHKKAPVREQQERDFLQEIERRFTQRYSSDDVRPELRERFQYLLKRVLGDWRGQEIPLLPYRFSQMLQTEYQVATREDLILLGMANVYGWMAYTVYDDILDDEGQPAFLSVANLCLRELAQIFTRFLFDHRSFQKLFVEIMDDIDAANTWEVVHCRLQASEEGFIWPAIIPSYGELELLSQRSFGHALGPIACMFLAGFDRNEKEMQAVMRFFKHYLIARQLDDDAHDWDTDLMGGQVNCVAANLLRIAEQRGGRITILHQGSMAGLQEIFWQEEILAVAHSMLQHVQMAEVFLQHVPLVNVSFFYKMLEPIRASAQRALVEHAKTKDFLDVYQV